MADIAGLVIGVAALWQSCVQVYEIVDSTRQHGMEFELLSVKYEVERVRLLCWGDAVGLAGVVQTDDNGTAGPSSPRSPPRFRTSTPVAGAPSGAAMVAGSGLDVRLRREDVRGTVLRLLGCIQHVFENTDGLQEKYGLQQASAVGARSGGPVDLTTIIINQAQGSRPGQDPPPSQSERILNGVFRRAYDHLRRIAGERQQRTPLTRRTVWAVRDRRKFGMLVGELRGFNDSLESIFPDAQARAADAMRLEIEGAVDVRELQLLQIATVNEHRELSECASVRLEALGATVSARTELLSNSRGLDDGDDRTDRAAEAEDDWEDASDEDGGVADNIKGGGTQRAEGDPEPPQPEPEVDELTKRLNEVGLYVEKKNVGALTLSLLGPYHGMAHVTGHVYWDGDKRDRSFPTYWDDQGKGFVGTTHAAFDMYKRKKYFRKETNKDYEQLDSEDYTLLDPEGDPKFENENPGTVTVEGYGLEAWEFEKLKPTNKGKTIMVNHSKLPSIKAKTLLRRMDELQHHGEKFGWNPEKEELDLEEMVGDMGIIYYDQKYARDPKRRIGDLYSLLNRTDVFADFSNTSSVGLQWSGGENEDHIGIWNFLYQVIVAHELAIRLKNIEGGSSYTGFTERILGSLIVSDLWLKHVRVILVDAKLPRGGVKGAETAEDKAKAEEFKNQGNEALKKKEYQKAIDLYTEAIKLDLSSAVYRCNRSAALIELERYEHAEEDAYLATLFDPKYAKAWSRLGMAIFKLGDTKRAKKAYERALQVAGNEATPQMRRGLLDAEDATKAKIKAINGEKDRRKQHEMHNAFRDEDWEISNKTAEFHSLIHEQQAEGLLLFAQRMRWPYINEVRDYIEDAYSSVRAGGTIPIDLHDWLYGMMLPGKWFAFKIMAALVLSTPSLAKKVGVAPYFDCGVVLPTRSYWRLRTVLGKVLGCVPGVISLCGWIGPCLTKIEFEPPVDGPIKPQNIRVKARQIGLTEHNANSDGHIWIVSSNDHRTATRIRPDEEMEPYMAEMRDNSNWVIPEPPVRDVGTCEIVSVTLKRLALGIEVAQRAAQGIIEDEEAEKQAEYRASITFKRDDSDQPVTFKLFTNPVFVTPPQCRAGPKGPHEVHMRELSRYQQKNIWSVDRLKDHTAEDDDGDVVMIINATGKGAEVLARAWCSERGKCAVIRRPGGPCFVCAVRAASKASLGTGVLIWVG